MPLLDLLDPERKLLGVTPRGPLSLPPGGAHWYVVPRVGFPDPPTFHASFGALSEWLDGLGFPPEKTVIGGFSQGAVMSYALGLGRGRQRPAAIVALSGFVPTVDGWEPNLEQPLPRIAIGHGTEDPVISVEFSRRARMQLEDAGATLLYREYPLPHMVEPHFLREVADWLVPALA